MKKIEHLTTDQLAKLSIASTVILRNIEHLNRLFDGLNADQRDELNEIIGDKYPFNFDLQDLAYEVKAWHEGIQVSIGNK